MTSFSTRRTVRKKTT